MTLVLRASEDCVVNEVHPLEHHETPTITNTLYNALVDGEGLSMLLVLRAKGD